MLAHAYCTCIHFVLEFNDFDELYGTFQYKSVVLYKGETKHQTKFIWISLYRGTQEKSKIRESNESFIEISNQESNIAIRYAYTHRHTLILYNSLAKRCNLYRTLYTEHWHLI